MSSSEIVNEGTDARLEGLTAESLAESLQSCAQRKGNQQQPERCSTISDVGKSQPLSAGLKLREEQRFSELAFPVGRSQLTSLTGLGVVGLSRHSLEGRTLRA